MELYEAILGRRTVHHYLPEAVAEEVMERVLAAGHQAPCHKMTWPWAFVRVGPVARAALAALGVALKEKKGPLGEAERRAVEEQLLNPGALVAVTVRRCADPFQAREDYAAAACAIQNMLLAICAEGLGGKWGTGAVSSAPKSYEILGVDPAQEEIIGFVWVGVPKVVPVVERPPVAAHTRRVP